MRNNKEIEVEIATLEEQRKTVRGGTNDNISQIAAQIRVLRERFSNDDIYDTWNDDENDTEIRMAASDAMDWMNGERDQAPSEDWKELCA